MSLEVRTPYRVILLVGSLACLFVCVGVFAYSVGWMDGGFSGWLTGSLVGWLAVAVCFFVFVFVSLFASTFGVVLFCCAVIYVVVIVVFG